MDDRQRIDLEAFLEGLRGQRADGATAVSVYAKVGRQVHQVVDLLRREMAEAENIQSRETRKGVLSSLQSALSLARRYEATGMPRNGLAILAGPGASGSVEPPEPLGSDQYHCGQRFDLGPLEAMLESRQLYGLVVIDRKECSVGLLRGTRVECLWTTESGVRGKHHMGGQSQARYARIIQGEFEAFLKAAAQHASKLLLPRAGAMSGVFVGGPGMTKLLVADPTWMGLDYRVRSKVVLPAIDVGQTDEHGLHELAAKAGELVPSLELGEERRLVARLMSQLRDGGAAVGKEEVDAAVASGRAELVLCSDARVAQGYSGHAPVRLVSRGSTAGDQFARGLGGLAALLRW